MAAKQNEVLPVAQFAASTFYCREGERLKVSVQRLGPCASSTSSVDWKTEPSHYEGIKFKGCSGILTFQPGELFHKFEIPLLDDDSFGACIQFRMTLSNPIGCTLGTRYADVMMTDNDVFPTNRFKQKLEADRTTESWQKGESWNMFRQWAKFIFRHTPGSKKKLVSDQVDNLIFIIEIIVMKLLVNVLSTDEAGPWFKMTRYLSGRGAEGRVEPPELNAAIVCFGLFLLVPFAITHWLMYRQTTWKITGGARAVLQENLLRKYLSQDESRSFAPTTLFLDTFGYYVGLLVVDGYNKLFAVAKSIGRLLWCFALTLFYAIEATTKTNDNLAFMGLLPFFVLPICMSIIHMMRREQNLKTLDTLCDTEFALLAKVDKCTDCHRMVFDMDTREVTVADCRSDIFNLNAAIAKWAGRMANNQSVVHWATEALCLLWIVIGGHEVAVSLSKAGEATGLDLGTFLAILHLIRSNGAEFENLFDVFHALQTTFPEMWNMVMLMNLRSDLDVRIQQQQERLKTCENFVTEVHAGLMQSDINGSVFPEDSMPLKFEQVSFAYPTQRQYQISGFTKQIQQGSLIAFTGSPASGKSTILKLVGDVLPLMPLHTNTPGPLNITGTISIPPYLRTLHVSSESMIWPGTLAENIFFGVCASLGLKTDEYATLDRKTLERGWHVCRRLHFPQHLQELAEDLETQQAFDHFSLPESHKKLIHLARALTSNPEVLVIHRPSFFLGPGNSVVVMDALREFVKLRGLVPDDQPREPRRPRTVFFSSVEPLELRYADCIVDMGSVDNDELSDNVDDGMEQSEVLCSV